MGLWKASTADCVTSASTSTCSPTSARHARSSKNGGSTTIPTDHTRASTGSHQLSSQHAPIRGITGTDSTYEWGQVGEQVSPLSTRTLAISAESAPGSSLGQADVSTADLANWRDRPY